MRATVFLLAFISFRSSSPRHNEPHRLRQATRHSVIGRALDNKTSTSTPAIRCRRTILQTQPVGATNDCPESCVFACNGSCNLSVAQSNNTVTVTEAKRDADIEILGGTPTQKRVWPATRHWIPIVDFDGLMLPPIQAAQFMRSRYLFDHPTNGSVNLRDEAQFGTGRRGGLLVKFSGSWFVKYIAKQLAQGESDGFAPEDLVMKLSNEYGLKASDLIPMNRLLLADPNLKRSFSTSTLTRDMLEYMVEAMCPALDP
ncbi:hypothetical protein BKA62DRAFT_830506 [Auriculariales sp. MPI-PUGE-AT-0066]|nr:hypothetical protein BKA62DRAFT_830506 [Auriculariales sp. MPI-PUGE-AT-0066]